MADATTTRRGLTIWNRPDGPIGEERAQQYRNAGIDADAGAWIAQDAVLAPGCRIEKDAVVCTGARIHSGAQIQKGTLIGAEAQVGRDATVRHEAVVGVKTTIGPDASVGSRTMVGEGSNVEAGTIIGPMKEIGTGVHVDSTHPSVMTETRKSYEDNEREPIEPVGYEDGKDYHDEGIEVDPSARIHPTARIHHGADIGPGCIIEADAVIGPGARLEKGNTVGPGAIVGEQATLRAGTTLGEQSIVDRRSWIGEGSTLGAGCVIEHQTTVQREARIEPHEFVNDRHTMAISEPLVGPEPTLSREEQVDRLLEQLDALKHYGVTIDVQQVEPTGEPLRGHQVWCDYDQENNALTVSGAAVSGDERISRPDFTQAQQSAYQEIAGYLLVGPGDREAHPNHPRGECAIPERVQRDAQATGNATYQHIVQRQRTREMSLAHGSEFGEQVREARDQRHEMASMETKWSTSDDNVWNEVKDVERDVAAAGLKALNELRSERGQGKGPKAERTTAAVAMGDSAPAPAAAPAPARGTAAEASRRSEQSQERA